jgi:hypothetical protein
MSQPVRSGFLAGVSGRGFWMGLTNARLRRCPTAPKSLATIDRGPALMPKSAWDLEDAEPVKRNFCGGAHPAAKRTHHGIWHLP